MLAPTLLLPGCAAVHGALPWGRPEGPRVVDLRFEGLSAVSNDELAERMLTTESSLRPWVEDRPFEPATLREDLERIHSFYRTRGYYETEAESELTWNREQTRVRVLVRVVEGEPVRLRGFVVDFEETPDLDAAAREAITSDLGLELGEVFGVASYRSAREALLRRLADRGYPEASLAGGAEVKLATHAASVEWHVDPGPLVFFGPVQVAGLDDVDAELVLREVSVKSGERYSLTALERSQEQVYGVGLFRSVSVQATPPQEPRSALAAPEPDASEHREAEAGREAEERWPVSVRVEERPPRTVRAGIGFGTEDLLRVKLSWEHRNFFGGLRRLSFSAKASAILQGVEGRFLQPRFLDDLTELELRASAFRETTPAFDANRFKTAATLRRKLGDFWTARIGHGFELVDVRDLANDDEVLPEDLSDFGRLSTFLLGLERKQVDDDLEPTRGTWLDLEIEPSLVPIGSEVNYLRATLEARAYVPLPLESVLALRMRVGTLEPLGGFERSDIPVVKRFFSGGSTSVRGFDFQKLGPLDENDDPLGGLSLAEASTELRFPIWRGIGGVVFVDAGQIALESATFRAGDVLYSTGGGLRYRTPIGPLRLDFGYVLNPPSGIDRFRVHFSVGHAF